MRQEKHLLIPEAGDRGKTFCPSISQNMEILDSHTHNGSDSDKISSENVLKSNIVLAEGDWASNERGFKQSVSLPTGFTFDEVDLVFTINTGPLLGQRITPTIVKTSSSTFDVFVTLGNYDLKVVFS
jgi:hypothetical protein